MIINLTPHAITILSPLGDYTIPPRPREEWARVGELRERREPIHIAGELYVPVNLKAFDRANATGIPAGPVRGIYYIVSAIVAEAFPARDDLLIPDEIQRDMKGEILGCHSLARLVREL